MITSWKQKVHTPKLRTYATFNFNFGVEPYVVSYRLKSERYILAQLRVGSLALFDCVSKAYSMELYPSSVVCRPSVRLSSVYQLSYQ